MGFGTNRPFFGFRSLRDFKVVMQRESWARTAE
jgi:hypothetical protein